MTPEKLAELEKLEEAATPGPPCGRWQASAKAGAITWGKGACLLHNGSGAGVPSTDLYLIADLRNNARDLFATLREAWRRQGEALVARNAALDMWNEAARERDEARANYEQGATFGTLKRLNAEWEARCGAIEKERDEARAALRLLWEEAESKCALRDSTEDAVMAALGEG